MNTKEHIRCNQKKYDNSSRFHRDYYGSDCGKLVRAIREYKRTRGSKTWTQTIKLHAQDGWIVS